MANKPCKDCIHKEACITANPDMVKKTYKCSHYKSTADIAEVKCARWKTVTEIKLKQVSGKIPVYLPKYHGQCSSCNHSFVFINETHFKHCPNCGAKMDGGKAE